MSAADASGRRRTRMACESIECMARASVLQVVKFLDLDGVALAEQRDDDGQADGNFGRGDREDEENEDVAVEGAVELRERHQRQRRREQHELEAHVDDERVLAEENAEETDREEQRGDQQVGLQAVNRNSGEERDHDAASFLESKRLLSTITPSMAIRSMKPTICTGRR